MGLKENLENHPGLIIGGFIVAGFLSGFGAYKAILEVANQDVVTAGTYLSKEECRNQVAMGFSHEELAAQLLDLLQPTSEENLMAITRSNECAGPFVRPEAKVEILAYLNVGEEALRRKAVLAYANCASGLNEAFLLARTIKRDESPATFSAYAFALWAITHRYGEPDSMERMENYLIGIRAPQGLLAAFLQEERAQDSDRATSLQDLGENQGAPNPSLAADGRGRR